MKQKNLATLLGIALVVALLATGVFYGLFVTKLKSSASGKTIVVAAKGLEAGTTLVSTDVKAIAWPANELPDGAYEKPDQLIGKTLLSSLSTSEPVLASRLASEEGGGPSATVPPGMRAISVHVSDSSSLLNLLHAGHKVDVQVLIPRTNATVPQLRTILENVPVLAVSPKLEPNSQGFSLPIVTLITKPTEADALALADSSARIRLTLRNPVDTSTMPHQALTLPGVMQADIR
jgi:pilus assembly protein CpaB